MSACDATVSELVHITTELVAVVSRFVYLERISEYRGVDPTYPDMERTLSGLAERLAKLV